MHMTKLEKLGILLFLQAEFGSIAVLVRDHQIDTIGGYLFFSVFLTGAAFYIFGGMR
jgi:hypothetical protein